jgi:hypothetical protein
MEHFGKTRDCRFLNTALKINDTLRALLPQSRLADLEELENDCLRKLRDSLGLA